MVYAKVQSPQINRGRPSIRTSSYAQRDLKLPTFSEGVDVTLRLRPFDAVLGLHLRDQVGLSFKAAISAVLNLPHFWAIFIAYRTGPGQKLALN